MTPASPIVKVLSRSATCWRIRVPVSSSFRFSSWLVGFELLGKFLDPHRPEDPLLEEPEDMLFEVGLANRDPLLPAVGSRAASSP